MSMPWKWIWAFIAVTNATVLLINIGVMCSSTVMIDVAQVQKEAGYAYRIPLNEVEGRILGTQFSTWDRRIRQQVAFFENGSEVGLNAASLRQISGKSAEGHRYNGVRPSSFLRRTTAIQHSTDGPMPCQSRSLSNDG